MFLLPNFRFKFKRLFPWFV